MRAALKGGQAVLYEKNNGNSISFDALLSQAGIPSDEVADLLHDGDEPHDEKTAQEKKEEALKSAKALADLPGMPGFLKPTRTMAAAEAARTDADRRSKDADGTATATTTATDNNGQGFKVTVMVSPDGETSAEATALREGATSSKPAPVTFSSPYGSSEPDPRYYPQNQAGSSSFAQPSRPSMSFNGAPNSMPFGNGAADSFGFAPNPSIPFETHNSVSFTPHNSMPFGPDPALAGGTHNSVSFGHPSSSFDAMGAVTYDPNASMNPSIPLPPNGFGGQGAPALPSDPFAAPSADGIAAAQLAAAQAAQNAAMVDVMAAYGPDAVPEDAKKRFFGKKKREKAAQKAAEEAAAYAAATAAAAAEAAAAEEIARHQPTAYIPTTPPSQFGGATPPSDPFADQQMPGAAGAPGAMGATGIIGAAGLAGAAGAMGAMGMGQPGQPGMAIQPVADTSGFDQLTSALPMANGAYPNNMMPDPSVTTGMPPVGQMGMMGANGSYGPDAMGMPGYDQFGFGGSGSGMTPEGVAALEAMRTEMNDASASHNKRVRIIKIIIASVVGLIAAAAITFGILIATNVISLDDLGINVESGVHDDSGASSSASGGLSYHSSSSSSGSSAGSSASSSSSASDSSNGGDSSGGAPSGAGDEIYHYTLTTIDGEHPTVTEVVSFDDEGLVLQTAMDAVFSTATAAQAFVERVRSDYGSNFLSGSVDGTTAHVVVNMARSKLTREGYENALRNVVDGLEIERLT